MSDSEDSSEEFPPQAESDGSDDEFTQANAKKASTAQSSTWFPSQIWTTAELEILHREMPQYLEPLVPTT
jgi:hypothetical protein